MIRFNYNDTIYFSYYQLLIDLIENADEDNIVGIEFPLDYEIYICSLLNNRFSDINLNVEDFKQILAEELALKNITLKEPVLQSAAILLY